MASTHQEVRIFGIRHHGPGSALRLLEQLKTWQPDALLLECPADAQGALAYIGTPALQPPVAILLYDPGDVQQAVHLPLAVFSPEWQALHYADVHGIPAIAMDLPWSIQRQLVATPGGREAADPFAVIAAAMAYPDTERWWEYFFEQVHGETDLFPQIIELMAVFRAEAHYTDTEENQLREAWMRQTIREAWREGRQRIAVVCGAFHSPALRLWADTEREDTSLLKTKKTGRSQATWVPWSYSHLARESGYGAGVHSPAWYELLYEQPQQATPHWMTRCAHFLREKGLPGSPAATQAAVEMAESLAVLRQMHQPGFTELEEAALAVLAMGDPQWLSPMREQLLVGDRIGKVPAEIPGTPLESDFRAAVRSARLSRALETPGKIDLELDLRKPANRLASTLLHRLHLLHLPWGQFVQPGEHTKGRFRERWRLEWKPRYSLQLIEASRWGLTLEEAANQLTRHHAGQTRQLAPLAQWMRDCLLARLPATAESLARMLQDQSALTQDIWDLAEALSPLIQIHHYGEGYESPPMDLQGLIQRFIPRILIGLPKSLTSAPAEDLEAIPGRIRQLLLDLTLWDHKPWLTLLWNQLLPLLDEQQLDHGLHGTMLRLAWEEGQVHDQVLGQHIRFRLASHQAAVASASWVSGLLHGNEGLLLRHKLLWQQLDYWVSHIPESDFLGLLPQLRQVFSGFSPVARRQLAARFRQEPAQSNTPEPTSPPVADLPLTELQKSLILPLLRQWLNPEAP